MILDEELREVYQLSSQTQIEKIESGILELQKNPDDRQIVAEVKREIHTLKGDSKLVGLEAIANVCASLENIFAEMGSGLTLEASELIFQGVDALKFLVEEALKGIDSGIDPEEIIALLQSDSSIPAVDSEPTTDQLQPTASSYIEDDELREVYQFATGERLASIEAALLNLEKRPNDPDVIITLFRDAHTLKGDSRVVGVESVEQITHAMEDIFGLVKQQQLTITSDICDCLYQSLDAIKALVDEAITATPCNIDYPHIIAQLRAIAPNTSPPAEISAADVSTATQNDSIDLDQLSSTPTPTEVSAIKNAKSVQSDTVRVAAKDLDALVTQAGELTVAKNRQLHIAAQIEAIANQYSSWRSESQASSQLEQLEQKLQSLRLQVQDNCSRLEAITTEIDSRIRHLRLVPLNTVFQIFPRMVRDLAKQQGKQIEITVEGGETGVDKLVLEGIKDSLMHIVRNAIDHGIETPEERTSVGKAETATLKLRAKQKGDRLLIEVSEDGRGLDLDKIKQKAIEKGLYTAKELEGMSVNQIQNLIFVSGFSTRSFITEISGRGVGMDVVRSQIEQLKGNIEIYSVPGCGCTFAITLPTTLTTAQVMLVQVQGMRYAIPIEFIHKSIFISLEQVFMVEEQESITIDDQTIPIADLADLLDVNLDSTNSTDQSEIESQICVLLEVNQQRFGLLVDQLIDTQEIILKPQSKVIKRIRNISGATILADGEVCMVLNPQDLVVSILRQLNNSITKKVQTLKDQTNQLTILLTDDSITVRTQEKRILERAGYQVITAVDGLDGYNKLIRGEHNFDAVISDVEMPNMTGLDFAAKIREHSEFDELPIILVTSLETEADKRRGAEAGANAYIVKGRFKQELLLETLERLI